MKKYKIRIKKDGKVSVEWNNPKIVQLLGIIGTLPIKGINVKSGKIKKPDNEIFCG